MTSSRRDRNPRDGTRPPRAQSPDEGTALPHGARSEVPSAPGSDRAAIVCGVDHSEDCRRALRVAAELAERLDSRLVLVNVRPSPADLPPGMAAAAGVARERAVEGGRRLLAELGDELLDEPLTRRLLECVRGRVEFGEPAARLSAVADEIRASLIVVGARGRGAAGAALLGSVSQSLAAEPSRPLLVVPPEAGGRSGASGTPLAGQHDLARSRFLSRNQVAEVDAGGHRGTTRIGPVPPERSGALDLLPFE